jgi:hypothetical protein
LHVLSLASQLDQLKRQVDRFTCVSEHIGVLKRVRRRVHDLLWNMPACLFILTGRERRLVLEIELCNNIVLILFDVHDNQLD